MSFFALFSRRGVVALSVAALAVGLGACSHVPVKTAWQLRNFDPMTTDPARLRAAVAMPREALPAQGGAKLVMKQARKDGSDAETVEIALEEVALASETGLSAVKPKPGQEVRAFRIPAAEVPRLAEARERARARAAAAPGVYSVTLSVGIDGCRREGVPLPKEFHVSTWMKTAETVDYLPVIEDLDLVAMLGAEKLAAEARVCPAS